MALPDITLLPKLANFFGVSADEFLELKSSENETDLRRYEKEYANAKLTIVLCRILSIFQSLKIKFAFCSISEGH